MPGIFHNLTINAPAKDVFNVITTSRGLDVWWTKNAEGIPMIDRTYLLDFGPNYLWEAIVTKSVEDMLFELQMTKADAEWMDTRIGFILNHDGRVCRVSFYHTNWKEETENFKYSNYCWAMYLRLMKRYVEHKETVAYEMRLKV